MAVVLSPRVFQRQRSVLELEEENEALRAELASLRGGGSPHEAPSLLDLARRLRDARREGEELLLHAHRSPDATSEVEGRARVAIASANAEIARFREEAKTKLRDALEEITGEVPSDAVLEKALTEVEVEESAGGAAAASAGASKAPRAKHVRLYAETVERCRGAIYAINAGVNDEKVRLHAARAGVIAAKVGAAASYVPTPFPSPPRAFAPAAPGAAEDDAEAALLEPTALAVASPPQARRDLMPSVGAAELVAEVCALETVLRAATGALRRSDPAWLCEAGYAPAALLAAGYTLEQLRAAGFKHGFKSAGVTVGQLKVSPLVE